MAKGALPLWKTAQGIAAALLRTRRLHNNQASEIDDEDREKQEDYPLGESAIRMDGSKKRRGIRCAALVPLRWIAVRPTVVLDAR